MRLRADCHAVWGQPVTMMLGGGVVAMRAEGELFAGESVVVMDVGPMLPRKQPAEWASAFERKISRLSRRAADVEHLYAEIEKSPSPEKTGAIVLGHAGDCDDDFFEALATVIAHDKARLRLSRVRNFQAPRAYLCRVRGRARAGETAAMRRELAQGAAQERELGRSGQEMSAHSLCPLPAPGALFTATARWSRRNNWSPARRKSRAHGKTASWP